MLAISTSACPAPTVSIENDLKAGGVEQLDDGGGGARQPAQAAAGSHAADENARVTAQVAHADAIAEQGAAAERAAGIDGDDAYEPLLAAKGFGQLVDQGALAGAGRPGDTPTTCAWPVWG
jgi:hypothetical protein